MTLRLKPSEMCFSQNSINSKFHKGRKIGNTLDDICEGRTQASSFPSMRVAKRKDKWFTEDNRRLWLFRQLERLGKCGDIPVVEISKILSKKMTTQNGGESVQVRGFPGGTWASKPDVPVSQRNPANYVKLETVNVKTVSLHTRSRDTWVFDDYDNFYDHSDDYGDDSDGYDYGFDDDDYGFDDLCVHDLSDDDDYY